ncbi:dihydroorotate dehydrogenase [Bacillus sp. REN3]|uniref:dihydroorotate dehydrogenase n=1 Tax=Bacillus sp. REN3 TaxID=2802440 RepID=UPI001AED79DA|nr:dihydroorotate dehydrogenase [Bacillus sp. REN3]
MPDWSYHPLFKPWLSHLPGNKGREFIHRGMSAISRLPGGMHFIEFLGHMAPSDRLTKRLFSLTFSSPVGLSGKIDPLLSGIDAFPHLGFGLIEVGPVTTLPSRPDFAARYSANDHAILYPITPESIGLEMTVKKLARFRNHHARTMIRLGGEDATLLSAAKALADSGDLFAVEISQIHSNEHLLALKNEIGPKPLLVAIKASETRSCLERLQSFGKVISGFVIEEDALPEGKAMSVPLKQADTMVTAIQLIRALSLPVIASGGVEEPEDALAFFEAGADLVLLSGGYVASGPGLPKRINEALLDRMVDQNRRTEASIGKGKYFKGWIWYWLFGLSILIGGVAALVFSLTKVILFYDEDFLQMSRLELIAFSPSLYKFMSHDRMTLAGTMVSGGFVYMQLARHGVRHGIHWARKAINIAGTLGFLGISLFLGYGYFDWLHGVFWLILFPLFLLGWRSTVDADQSPESANRKNHPAWKKANYGQLAFVLLGCAFVAGGAAISVIGATSVFVDTDLQYICMTPDQLTQFNEMLIPVIAHDRAGFGSALFSVGLLVLMLALWGFHEGDSWVWNTFLFGGMPAFFTGIYTHYYIGYTDFIHLLPAYIAIILYIIGLFFSRDFLRKRIEG